MTAERAPIIDAFFEFAPDAILVVDAKHCIVGANGRAEALFGYPREELIGKNAEILLPQLQQQARDKADGGEPLAQSFAADPAAFARRRDGVEFPVDIMPSPLTADQHSILTVRDITERKRAEMALSQAYRQLELGVEQHARKLAEVTAALRAEIVERRHTEEQLLRHAEMLDLTHEPIFAWEIGKGIFYWNEGAARLYGYSKDEAMGRVSHELLSTFHPRGMAQVEATLNRKRRWSGELVHTTRDQRKITVESRMVLVHGSEGKELVIESNRDITERLQSEMALRQAQKMEAVGQLTGGLAHDFNNLLTVMSGNLQMLRERGGLDARLLKLVDAAGKAAERGAELIQKLLAFSRRQPLRPREIDLNQLVAAMTAMLGRTLGEDIQIETRLAPALPSAVVDPGQVENALLNLALNSRDAMPGGGRLMLETAYLEVTESNVAATGELAPGCYLRLTVSDNGHGMSAEVAERAFEPFFTTKPLGKGSGLGLAMLYGFVKQSGGYARIESELGQGTTVKLYLPAAMASLAPESVQLEGDSEAVIGHEIVLVVEDEQAVRELACAFLSDSGYSVREAENGPAALSCLKQNTAIDLLFADVVMPGGLSGPELAREALRLRPDLAVLFTSGYAEHALTHDEVKERTVELISKPYTKEALARKVRSVLDQRSSAGRRDLKRSP